jgi:hypothetical protein
MIGSEGCSDSPEVASDSESCGDCIGVVAKACRWVLIDVDGRGTVVIMEAIRRPLYLPFSVILQHVPFMTHRETHTMHNEHSEMCVSYGSMVHDRMPNISDMLYE